MGTPVKARFTKYWLVVWIIATYRYCAYYFLLQLTLSAPWLRIRPEMLQNQWKNAIFAFGFGLILEPLLGSAEAPEMDPKMGSKMGSKRRSKQMKICKLFEKISVFLKNA